METKVLTGLLLALLLTTLTASMLDIETAEAETSEPTVTEWTGLGGPYAVDIGDYNNDGLNDIAFSEGEAWAERVTVYDHDGSTVLQQWTGLTGTRGIAMGDYNNDGLTEMAISEINNFWVTVYMNDGVTIIAQFYVENPMGLDIGDYDNDGLNDIAIVDHYGSVTVYSSDGFTIIAQWAGLGPGPHGVAIGDYDNDGLNDLAFSETSANKITVYKSDGVTIIDQLTGLSGPDGVAIGDYNNDGLNDFAISEELGDRVIVNYGATHADHDVAVTGVYVSPTSAEAGQYVAVNVTVENQGIYEETFNVTVYYDSIAIGPPQTITSMLNGTTLNLAFNWDTTGVPAGTYAISAEASLAEDAAPSDNFFVDGTVSIYVAPPPSVYTRLYLPHEWVEGGVAMGWHADDNSWLYTLPFDFPFYGTYYRTIYISSNGLISFTGYDSSWGNSISGLAGKLAIAVAWDDLATYYPRDIFIWQSDSTHVIVRWNASPLYNTAFTVEFEAILGADGVIQLNYGYNDGSISATVGISNGVGEIIAEDITNCNYINSILFTPYRPEHDLSVHLEAPPYLLLGQSAILNATLDNLGSSDELDVELQLRINDEVVSSVIIPDLISGTSYMLSLEWTPTAEGSYNVLAYAPPVPEETITANNIQAKIVNILALETSFSDNFSSTTLDPHWQVWRYGVLAPSPPEAYYQRETRFSLTDSPGYLRYYHGDITSHAANQPVWQDPYWYYPSSHVCRAFEATDWVFETKITYYSPYSNAWAPETYIRFGNSAHDFNNFINIHVGSGDGVEHWIRLVDNGVEKALVRLPIFGFPVEQQWPYWLGYHSQPYVDTVYYRILRAGHQFTVMWSNDGFNYNTVFTETMGSQIDGLTQFVDITGQAFWSDFYAYAEYDYVSVQPPPEHELEVSLEVPGLILLGQSALLNATVYNGGLNSETNAELQLLIDGSLVSSVVIPELPTGSSHTLSYSWTATTEGTYSVIAYAIPVPEEADTTNNEQIAVVLVVRPLIQPIEGQWANYTITSPYGTQLINTTYSHYISPVQMHVTLWMRDMYGNTMSDWLTLNIMTRQVEAGVWSGFWYPLWVQTNVAIGSTAGILYGTGIVTESRYIEVGDYLVECWGLQVLHYDMLYTFWFDKVNGLVVAADGVAPYNNTQTWRLTSTNVPLMYLPRLRVQTAPESGPVGTEVTITGDSAMPNSSVEIYWDNTYIGTAAADENGNFAYTLTVPPSTRGMHTIEAVDLATGLSDAKTFAVLSTISITPASGPMGTKVQVTGLGFGANEHVILTFEDMHIAEINADSSGSFTATFNIPLAQSGQYQVKAWYGTDCGQTTFAVIEVSKLDVTIDVGAIYFKGETAEFYVQTAFNGRPIDVTTLNIQLHMPNGTATTLTYSRIAKGLYRILFSISGRGSMIGTYTVVVEAAQTSSTLDAYGTSIRAFIVKPTWERELPKMAALSIASIGLIGTMVVLWKKEKKRYL